MGDEKILRFRKIFTLSLESKFFCSFWVECNISIITRSNVSYVNYEYKMPIVHSKLLGTNKITNMITLGYKWYFKSL